jgi:hypothetical protein
VAPAVVADDTIDAQPPSTNDAVPDATPDAIVAPIPAATAATAPSGGLVHPGRPGADPWEGVGGYPRPPAAPAPVVPRGRFALLGVTLSKPVDQAEFVVRRALGADALRCYERALAADPTTVGNLSMAISIGPSGEPDRVTVSGDTGVGPAVAGCIAAILRRLQFAGRSTNDTVTLVVSMAFSHG